MVSGISYLLSEIEGKARDLTPEVIRLRRDLHQHPELSHQEERTAGVVARYLEEYGLNVRTGIAGHGVMGTFTGARAGKVVAFRADMDALPLQEKVDHPWRSRVPGVMHACGHDFHVSIALATARLLSGMKDKLAGEFRFIFQPAEEEPRPGELSAAQSMAAAGVLADPPVNAILAVHTGPHLDVGQIRYSPDVVMAGADRLRLIITGQSAHGATPHRGVDPILVSAQALNQIQGFLVQKIDARAPVVLTFGTICGGNRFNILAERVTLEGSLRYLRESVRRDVLQGLRRMLAGLSQATGAVIELGAQQVYPILRNDASLSLQAAEVIGKVLGARPHKLPQPAMGSEDFSYFAEKVPGFYFFLGVRTPGTRGQALHSPDFDPDEDALPLGLKVVACLLACLNEPHLALQETGSGDT